MGTNTHGDVDLHEGLWLLDPLPDKQEWLDLFVVGMV